MCPQIVSSGVCIIMVSESTTAQGTITMSKTESTTSHPTTTTRKSLPLCLFSLSLSLSLSLPFSLLLPPTVSLSLSLSLNAIYLSIPSAGGYLCKLGLKFMMQWQHQINVRHFTHPSNPPLTHIFQQKEVKIHQKDKPWVLPFLKALINQRQILFNTGPKWKHKTNHYFVIVRFGCLWKRRGCRILCQ